MLGQNFYFSSLRNTVVGFGALFDNVQINRQDNDSATSKLFQVPLSYAPREHYMATLRDAAKGVGIQSTLPRMSYEMTGLTYDPTRKLATTGYKKQEISTPAIQDFNRQLNPVPYIATFDLNIYTRTIEDSLQLIEQIVAYFTPSFSITIKEIPEMNISRDVSVTLDGIQPQDTWENTVEELRVISWALSFSVEVSIYPPIAQSKVILQAIVDIRESATQIDETTTVTVDPITAKESDAHAIVTSITQP